MFQRLIHVTWCRQKERHANPFLFLFLFPAAPCAQVVTNHDAAFSQGGEAAGPRAELAFWAARTVDLSGIADQLHRPDVERAAHALQALRGGATSPSSPFFFFLFFFFFASSAST